jgi:hypothetical protein
MKVKYMFSLDEIIRFFRSNGFQVDMIDVPMRFGLMPMEASLPAEYIIPMWMVMNPQTGEWKNINEVFDKYMSTKRDELLNVDNKLDLIKSFE